ncbi:MAG: aliphatic sulfonates transporter [Rhodospirillales bacterium]|jgi:NitT/TauT family transport system substrate-binding protein|nr:aliphatic sulfonates transporter [Rhodospirillales bacterium]
MKRAIAVTVAGAIIATAATARGETIKLAIPQRGNWDTEIAEWGQKQGFFKEQDLDLAITYTEGGASNEQAVISGSVDIAVGTGILGIISAYVKGAGIRIIASEATGAPDLFFFALTTSGIKSMQDTHGKTIAGGAIQGVFTQVMSGQIDVGHSVLPLGLKEIKEGKIVVIARANDVPAVSNQTVRVNVANLAFIQQHRDLVVRFAKAYDKSLNWAYSDAKVLDYYGEGMHVSQEMAKEASTFFPKASMQPYEIRSLDLTLEDAFNFKRIPQPMKPEDIKDLIDIVWKPGQP